MSRDSYAANVIDLVAIRKGRELQEFVEDLQQNLDGELPEPEALGWVVVDTDESGAPTRWFNPKYKAFVGYVPAMPAATYLDYRNSCQVYDYSIGELVVGLEAGTLEAPLFEMDSVTDVEETGPTPQPGSHLRLLEPLSDD